MTPSTDPAASPSSTAKPRFAYAIATVLGTGYLKPGPGTWGSAVGLLIAVLSHPFTWFLLLGKGIEVAAGKTAPLLTGYGGTLLLLVPSVAIWLFLALLGVRTGGEVSQYAGTKDPQFVVIDEVSGVHLALLLGIVPVSPLTLLRPEDAATFALYSGMSILNWKFLLAAFLLFRLFDILKPFPCRRLEKLPGGWGIMADDWMAGVYAAICLRLALHFHWL
ncbi:MAG TPA: phosphatidylglycerophosphatase A [Candidatus Acidoferrum sp.]|nr:phosphatidylglycerophosphatase A [Candidatus Acidoferrum sp.]